MIDQGSTDTLNSKINTALFSHWLKLAEGDQVPLRDNLDPVKVDPLILPHIFLCSISFNPFKVHFRLQGTFITEYLGQTFTGKELNEETFGDAADTVRELYRRVAEGKLPIASNMLISSERSEEILIEVLHLPLVDELGKVSYIMGSIDAFDKEYTNKVGFTSKFWEVQATKNLLE